MSVEPPPKRNKVPGENPKLRLWLDRLNREDVPIFAHTSRCMASITNDDDSSAHELANVILRDSAMTARVLRLANSVHYNPSGGEITTVSYAIILLGFETIRNLALSIALIDTLLHGVSHEHALQELVLSFHAAIQAKNLAERNGQTNAEEIFIAALLNRLGNLLFWCFPNDLAQNLEYAYQDHTATASAERDVLGFSLDELTLALVKEWRLSKLVIATPSDPSTTTDPRLKDIDFGLRIASSVSRGWDRKEMSSHAANLGSLLSIPRAEAMDVINTNARTAMQALKEFGVSGITTLTPPDQGSDRAAIGDMPIELDADLQLRIARNLTKMLTDGVDLNTILTSILEGIYRALRMDRVILALVDPHKHQLRAKFVTGSAHKNVQENFRCNVGSDSTHFFSSCLQKAEPAWFKNASTATQQAPLPDELQTILGSSDFFCSPIICRGKAIGIIYADRHQHKITLSESDFASFQHFCEHAWIAFNLLSASR